MKKQESFRITQYGKKAQRRDYSKVSGTLDLPNLVEIQTDSFDWFTQEGIKEVFQEIAYHSDVGPSGSRNSLRRRISPSQPDH